MNFSNKILFFDVYQTLIDVDFNFSNEEKVQKEILGWKKFSDYLKHFQIDIDSVQFAERLAANKFIFYQKKDKQIYHHDLYALVDKTLKEHFGTDASKEQIENAIYEYRKIERDPISLYPQAADVLTKLSKKYTLAVASYTQRTFTQAELRELGIEKNFNYFFYTSDIGYRKSSTMFYKKCLDEVGITASDCAMIGDNYNEDFIVPQQDNIRAIWVKNPLTEDKFEVTEQPKYSLPLSEFATLPNLISRLWTD